MATKHERKFLDEAIIAAEKLSDMISDNAIN